MADSTPTLAVALGLWADRPAGEALETAAAAGRLGFGELWIGEMATYDAFALATAIGMRTEHITLTVGLLPVAVRDPAMIATGVASVSDLIGRRVEVALGTSSPVVVEEWHGRQRTRSITALRESAGVLRRLLDGKKSDLSGKVVHSRGAQLRLPAPASTISVAAFGPAAVGVAARHGDRMVVSLSTVAGARALAGSLAKRAEAANRARPRLAVWLPLAIGEAASLAAAREQIRRMLVGYLAAPGYAEMFEAAGFAHVVEAARSRPHPRELLAQIPNALVETVAILGGEESAAQRLASYLPFVDEIAVLPCSSDVDPAGVSTLSALARLREEESMS